MNPAEEPQPTPPPRWEEGPTVRAWGGGAVGLILALVQMPHIITQRSPNIQGNQPPLVLVFLSLE